MTPVPPHTLRQEQQLEYITKFMVPDHDSSTVSVKLDDPVVMLADLLTQISEIMLDEYETDQYETLILDRFEQATIVKVLYFCEGHELVLTFYETLDE
jgi:hypothetical protein